MRTLEQSASWLRRAKKHIPGCAQTFSKGPVSFVQGVAPNFLSRAEGAYVWDVDGNRYIDWIMGLGAVILGHGAKAVNDAVCEQLSLGQGFSLPHTIEVELAEQLCHVIPCADMVRFGKNGSDVTAAAVRVARAFTGRDKVACCGYHGWQDWYIGSTNRHLGVPGAVRALTLTFPYNDPDALTELFEQHPGEIACVIMEPVTFDAPRGDYLEQVAEMCHRHGTLLVFDEMITGFRFHRGGAQTLFGVIPDLACFGKAMANGFPLSAIVGRADIMTKFEQVFFSFTHGGETASMAACLATIRELDSTDAYATIGRRGRQLKQATRALIESAGLEGVMDCVGYPPWTTIRCLCSSEEETLALRSLFQQEALKRGLLTHGNHMVTPAHDESVIEQTLAAYAEIFPLLADAVRAGEVAERLEGPPIQAILRH
jgi:glutamate-1-semialdehyde aminotransferase